MKARKILLSELMLTDIQPSQFFISQEKLRNVKRWFDPADLSNFEPLPIKLLNGRLIFTDGHTRAWAAYEAGLLKVPFVWDEDQLDWELYQHCVNVCRQIGVCSVADFYDRVISGEEYKEKWEKWCERAGSLGAIDLCHDRQQWGI